MSESFNPYKDEMTGRIALGRYRIVRKLATGGMGVVYLARAEGAAGFVKPVVIKIVLPAFASTRIESAEMFAREARILANLQHPGIVSVIEFSQESDSYVMVLEYVHGYQLIQWEKYLRSKDEQIPTDVIIKITIDMLDALHYAHTLRRTDGEPLKIIHRDISPTNILLDTEGHVKLLDFGIASMEEKTDSYKSESGVFKGKLAYSAPELFSENRASVRSDVYSSGITLHTMLMGENEFHARGHAATLRRVLTHRPTSVHAVRDDAPDDIDEVIARALAKDPAERFQTAKDLATALRSVYPVDEQKVREKLTVLTRRDFRKEMAEFLGVESLEKREQAWLMPSLAPKDGGVAPISTPPIEITSPEWIEEEPDEMTAGPSADPASRNQMPAWRWAIWIVAALLAISGGVAAFLATRKPAPEERKFLLVQSPTNPEPAPEIAETPPTEEAPTDPNKDTATDDVTNEVTDDGKTPPIKKRTPKVKKRNPQKTGEPSVAALTRAFKKKKHRIQLCFERHGEEVVGTPKISILFQVEPSGAVDSAKLSPPALASTSLGNCILKTAKSTRFPRQSNKIAFRIPVKFWRAQK